MNLTTKLSFYSPRLPVKELEILEAFHRTLRNVLLNFVRYTLATGSFTSE